MIIRNSYERNLPYTWVFMINSISAKLFVYKFHFPEVAFPPQSRSFFFGTLCCVGLMLGSEFLVEIMG